MKIFVSILLVLLAVDKSVAQKFNVLANSATSSSNDLFVISQNGTGSRNISFGQLASNFAVENDKPVWNAVRYGANNGGSVDAWLGVEAAAARLRASGGTLLFQDGSYRLTNVVLVTGRQVTGNGWVSNIGNVGVRGTRLSRLDFFGATNCIEVVNGSRFISVSDLHVNGTNVTRLATPFQVGLLLHGPSGINHVDDCSFQALKYGIYLHDMTGTDIRNIACWSNFVGVAIGYKPDGVRVWGRFDGNVYGITLNSTNASQGTPYANSFSKLDDEGAAHLSGVFGYNGVGILVPRSTVHINGCYFEGNGTSIQIGLNSAVPYENAFGPSGGAAPVVYLENFSANAPNDIRIYRASTLFAKGCRWTGSQIRLMNAAADASVIDSDTAVNVIRSDATTVGVNSSYRYVAGAAVPRSGMSWTNLTDVPAGFADDTDDTGSGGFWDYTAPDLRWTNNVIVAPTNFTAYWPLDGESRDRMGTNDLIPVGDVAWNSGRVSQAFYAAGATPSGDRLYAPDSPELRYPGGPFSFGGWFQAKSDAADVIDLMVKTNEYRIYYSGAVANRIRVAFGNADLLLNESWTGTAPSGWTTNKLITVVWNGTTLSAQIMGGAVHSTNLSTAAGAITPPTPGTGGFAVLRHYVDTGGDDYSQADEVFISHYALSSGQRAALYNSGNGSAQTFPTLKALDTNVRDLRAHRYLLATNTAPTAVTVGTTVPDRWLQLYDRAGNLWFVPAWTNH